MAETFGNVLQLGEQDVKQVVDVLAESFSDYPVMRFVLGSGTKDFEQEGRTLIRFFVMARLLRKEPVLGIGDRGNLTGAALVSRPGATVGAPALQALSDLRERVWAELGPHALARYQAFGAACARFEVKAPHIHLNMVGVRRSAQGKGLGRRLIEHVHLLSRSRVAFVSALQGMSGEPEERASPPD
jgi:GNAT superfamily N-acetyltransferase